MTGVFCLGISTLDYVYSVETLPTRGEKYRSKGLAVVGGGCAGNASVAIARLGGRCWLATRLADDLTGNEIVADLAHEGVDTAFARRVPGLRSPVSAILVDAQGERMVISYSDPEMPEDTDWLPIVLPEGTRADVYRVLISHDVLPTALYHTLIPEICEYEFCEAVQVSRNIINLPTHQDITGTMMPKYLEKLQLAFREVYG